MLEEYSPKKFYSKGDKVSFKGKVYSAPYAMQGISPAIGWDAIGETIAIKAKEALPFSSKTFYSIGDRIEIAGRIYEALKPSQNSIPNSSKSWREIVIPKVVPVIQPVPIVPIKKEEPPAPVIQEKIVVVEKIVKEPVRPSLDQFWTEV